ncbi:MAG: hypothetical protein ACREOS_10480 [Candidatus Dormibacteraceae bacterium]
MGAPTPSIDAAGGPRQPERFFASDGRLLAVLARAGLRDYSELPPLTDAGRGGLTPVGWPLQAMLLTRQPGVGVRSHYHVNDVAAESATRHSVFVCLEGVLVINVYSREGEHAGEARLGVGDVLVVTEGHSVDAQEPGTRGLEVKQGPYLPYESPDVVLLEAKS